MSIWYPIFEFYLETHDRMLEEFGGFPGLELGAEMVFNASLEKVKQTEGDLFQKAGVMLERLRSDRIVKDAQKRTAYTVTATFLEMNGEKICVTDPEITSKFIKDILKYRLSEIVEWLKSGRFPEES